MLVSFAKYFKRTMEKGKAETKQKREQGSDNLSHKQIHSCYDIS